MVLYFFFTNSHVQEAVEQKIKLSTFCSYDVWEDGGKRIWTFGLECTWKLSILLS